MKHLIVSFKTPNIILDDFKKVLRRAKKSKIKTPHFEISFDNKKDFDRFVLNLPILKYVLAFKPKSIYELAKITGMDVSNLNKVILFLEESGALKVKTTKISGRTMRMPMVEYDKVEFDLVA